MSRRSWKRGITVVAVTSVVAVVVLGVARARRQAPCAASQSVTAPGAAGDGCANAHLARHE